MLINVDLPAKENESPKISLVIKSKYGSQWELLSAGAKAAANEYGVELSILAPDYERDIVSQKNLLLTAQKNGADAIIIAPIDESSFLDVISEVVNKGTPIMNIVTGTEDADVYSSLTTNQVEVGQWLGEAIENEIGADGRIVVLSSEEKSIGTAQKLTGLTGYLNENTTILIDDIIYVPSDIYSVQRLVSGIIDQTTINGIVALDQVATIGLGREIQSKGAALGAVGVNLYERDLDLVTEGFIDRIIDENYFAIGYLAVENTVNKMRDRGYVAHRLISPHMITKSNIFEDDVQKIIFPIK